MEAGSLGLGGHQEAIPGEAGDRDHRRGQSQGCRRRSLSTGRITIKTSADKVGTPLFYREVNLPFADAVKDPSRIRWRFGTISSAQTPPIVLEKLPVCGNCHSFSADGSVLGMDIDYANDKGSYAIAPVHEQMTLDRNSIITWGDYKRVAGRSDLRAALAGVARRQICGEHGQRRVGLRPQARPGFLAVVLPGQGHSVRLRPPDRRFSVAAGGGRPEPRPEQRRRGARTERPSSLPPRRRTLSGAPAEPGRSC